MIVNLNEPISQSTFAAIAGLSRPAVSQMIRDGTLSRGDTGLEWLQTYIGGLREAAAGRADSPAARQSRERILAAEAHRREELARMATQKRAAAEGLLLRTDDFDAHLAATLQAIRTTVWNWQGILPPLLHGRDMPGIAVALERETREMLEDASEQLGPRTGRIVHWLAENCPDDLWRDGGPLLTEASDDD